MGFSFFEEECEYFLCDSEEGLLFRHMDWSTCNLLFEFAFEGSQGIFITLRFVFHVFRIRRHCLKVSDELLSFKEVLDVMLEFMRSREVSEMDTMIVHGVVRQDFIFTEHFLEIWEIFLQSDVFRFIIASVEFDWCWSGLSQCESAFFGEKLLFNEFEESIDVAEVINLSANSHKIEFLV